MRAAEQSRDDVAEARAEWRDEQSKLQVEQWVFVDETWTSTNMAPRYGRGPRGKRVDGSAPQAHWLTMTFVAALRHDRIDAPCVFDGPINGDCFRAWTEQSLAPTLQPGDIVILDNLRACPKTPAMSALCVGQAPSMAFHGSCRCCRAMNHAR